MKNSLFLLAILGLFILNACEKTKDEYPKSDYYQLKTGNYWVYEQQTIYGDTAVETSPITDSIYIEKDTVINAKTYFKFTETNWVIPISTYFLRDSAGYLIDQHGNVFFSAVNTTDTLYFRKIQDLVQLTYKMDSEDSSVSVPAGAFNCLFYRCTIRPLTPNLPYTSRTQGDFRADGIGLVMSSIVNVGEFEYRLRKRLLRYHIIVEK